jgi:hypothetical protein
VKRAVVDGRGRELGGGVRRVQQVPEEVLVPVVTQRGVGRAPGRPVELARPATRRRDFLEPCKTFSVRRARQTQRKSVEFAYCLSTNRAFEGAS